MKDRNALSMLYNMIDHYTKGRDTPVAQRMVNQVLCKKRSNEEFKFNAQIREYDVDNVILDLGSDVNVLPKQSWEMMGEPELVWSPIHLMLANQHEIVPIGRLKGVLMNIDGVHIMANFDFIEIVDESQPYPSLMGLEWDFNNHAIIELKMREMIFEFGNLKVTAPLDPSEGKRYIELARGNDIEKLYNLTVHMEDYVDLTMNGALSWRSIGSCALDSESGLENWQQRMHEVSTRRCARINRSLRWIGTELCDPPKYDGITDIGTFVTSFELQVPEKQRLLALYVVLKVTPTRWWSAHRDGVNKWSQCNKIMKIQFGSEGGEVV
jgi:hypothetical protein